jgi:hypothetical protein
VGAGQANLHVTHDPALVRNGKGSLAIEYEASGSKPALFLLPVSSSLAGMKSLSMWLRADKATATAIFLNEKEGGRYAALVWLDPLVWQRIELTPEDFTLATGPGDPKDPDGKLDLDQIQAVGILDVSQIFNAALAESQAPIALEAHSGPQKLLVDDFEVSTDAPSWYKLRKPWVMDDFSHPCLSWLTLGGADLSLDTSGRVIPGNSLKATYQQEPEHFVVMVHQLPPMDLRGATHIAFDIASEKSATIVLSLEELSPGKSQGPRYGTNVEISGGGKPAHREVAISSLELDENGAPDPNKKLDLDQLKSITFVDITAAFTQEEAVNTIHVANVEAVKRDKP